MLSDCHQPSGGPVYVIDTNIIVDYVDIIPPPDGQKVQHEEPTIDLNGAHIVIPTAVIRELSSFKKEKNDRGKAARVALKRIREMVKRSIYTIGENYDLAAPLQYTEKSQTFSIFPVHKNFKKCLPFSPADSDMDGQIILASLAVSFALENIPVDGSASPEVVKDFMSDRVVLLTNDNGLAIRARGRGIMTSRYSYKYPEPYTGRRDVVVPKEMFDEFHNTQRIELKMWEELMPSQPKLVANEFIVMSLENPDDYPRDFDPNCNPYFCHIGRYDVFEEAIVKLQYVSKFPIHLYNAGQAIYAEALMNPDIAAIVCRGPAGSGKTYMATVYGYYACKNGEYIGVTVVPCETRSNLGALPGDLNEKMDPEVQPIKNALRNYLLKEDAKMKRELETIRKFGNDDRSKKDSSNGDPDKKSKKADFFDDGEPDKKSIKQKLESRVDLIWENWFSNIPIENARGRDFSYELAIYDEFQDQTIKQADTLIKRLGTDGKIIITGDIEQIHAPYIDAASSGIEYASRELIDSTMVAQVCFTEDEVMRHPLVKMVAARQKAEKSQQTTTETVDS